MSHRNHLVDVALLFVVERDIDGERSDDFVQILQI
jgi:hypothetical protein